MKGSHLSTETLHAPRSYCVFWKCRDGLLRARTSTAGPLTKDAMHRNQFGAVLSGPIVKGKTFFMVGWESQRNAISSSPRKCK
jgi:hypothetical protein